MSLVKPLWTQADILISEDEALMALFGDYPENLRVAASLYDWIKEALPFRCGVRLGKDRITFLVGNYRPAAIKKQGAKVRLDAVFSNILPEGFAKASEVWRTVDSTIEGFAVLDDKVPFLSEEDIQSFANACRRMQGVAATSRRHECNVLAVWPEGKE